MSLSAPTSWDADASLDACLTRWGLTPDPASATLLPVSKNPNLLCLDERGERILLKRPTGPGVQDLVREGEALDALSRLLPPEAPPLRVPRVVGLAPEAGTLALEWIAGGHAALGAKGGLPAAAVASRIGVGLGWLHTLSHTRPEALSDAIRARQDVFYLRAMVYLTPDFYTRLSPDGIQLFEILQADTEAFTALYELYQPPVSSCLVHGDMKATNLLVLPGNASPLVFLDWELAGWGDPARDLGAIISSYAVLMWAPGATQAVTPAALRAFVRRLMRAYRRARGQQYPLEADFSLRVARWTGACTVWAAYAQTHFAGSFGSHGRTLLDRGREMLLNPYRWAWELWSELP